MNAFSIASEKFRIKRSELAEVNFGRIEVQSDNSSSPEDKISNALSNQKYFKQQLEENVPALDSLIDEIEAVLDRLAAFVIQSCGPATSEQDEFRNSDTDSGDTIVESKSKEKNPLWKLTAILNDPTGQKAAGRTPEFKESAKVLVVFLDGVRRVLEDHNRKLFLTRQKLTSRVDRWLSIGHHPTEQSNHFNTELNEVTELLNQRNAWLASWNRTQDQAYERFADTFGTESETQVIAFKKLLVEMKTVSDEQLPLAEQLVGMIVDQSSVLADYVDENLIMKSSKWSRFRNKG
jgi:hypothetical protein